MSIRPGVTRTNCLWCGELLRPGEMRGLRQLDVMHYECSIRAIVGSVAHQEGRCFCFGKTSTEPDEPPEISKREHARMACRLYHSKRADKNPHEMNLIKDQTYWVENPDHGVIKARLIIVSDNGLSVGFRLETATIDKAHQGVLINPNLLLLLEPKGYVCLYTQKIWKIHETDPTQKP